ncbi:MAG TPA: signal peptide peptidase SppA [Polyangiaceae bacterium]|nr:signal peptide peptidase SppA [Polyangiaceae bacterium]
MVGLLVRVLWFLVWLLLLPWRAARRMVRVPFGTYLFVELDGAVSELPGAGSLRWPLAQPRRASLHDLTAVCDEMERDPRVGGLLIVLRHVRGGFATMRSLRDLLARARAAGKQVVVALPSGGATKETYAAVAADRVILGPVASLAPVGVLSSTRYLRGALDRAGIVPEVHARGRYKTAAETLELAAMSDPQREQVGAVLDRLHFELVQAIAAGRSVDEATARKLVDGAPYAGEEAKASGLVDEVAYEDNIAGKLAGGGETPALRPADGYLRSRQALRTRAFAPRGVLAVIAVHGMIVQSPGPPVGAMAVADRVRASIRRARADPRVRGVLLHVDSPGGGALASDQIHHELALLAAEKPLVACMGDVAASGGYYVAVAAHEIYAQPTTITGSIGVVSARLVIEPLLARLGVATEVLQRGEHARLLAPLVALDEGARGAVEREIEAMYRAFLQVVAAGRKRTPEEIEPLAQGRVWTGADAYKRGLVDRLGGFEPALRALRERVGVGAEKMRVVALRPPRNPMSAVAMSGSGTFGAIIRRLEQVALASGVDPRLLALADERVLVYSPWAAGIL